MASVNGINFAATEVTKPSEKAGVGEIVGQVRMLLDSIVLAAELSDGYTILFPSLPKGARVVGATLMGSGTFGVANGVLKLGNLASADASIAADNDSFVSSVVIAAAAGHSEMANGTAGSVLVPVAGLLKKFDQAVQVVAVFTGGVITTVATGKTVTAAVFYVLD